jgi:hypothetical protein
MARRHTDIPAVAAGQILRGQLGPAHAAFRQRMPDEERELTRRCVQRWRTAGDYLDAARARETPNLSTAEAGRWSDILLRLDTADAPLRTASGLPEKQAIFARWWKH